ncbi:MAG: PQQ-binding-like beta-propeller repeat protein [Opitutales bacterium]|jgi:outer membrane protein assembly factor BamB
MINLLLMCARQSGSLAAILVAGLLPSLLPGAPGWPVSTGGIVFSSPAIGPRGEIVFGSEDNKVYSINPNGQVRWVFEGGTDWFDSSPAIAADGTVYIGCWDNSLYAINGETGQLLWSYPTGSAIVASPAIGPDGTIYVGSYDGTMYALWPNGDPEPRWSREEGPQLSPINGGAALSNDGSTLYFGTDNGDLHALDCASGNLLWSYQVPAIHDLPDKPFQRAILGTPAVSANGDIYIGCQNGYLYEISPSGIRTGQFAAEDSILSSPVIDDLGRIFVASQDGYLYAIGADSGLGIMIELWELFIGDVFYCTPAMDMNGNIIIAGYTGNALNGPATTVYSVSLSGVKQWTYILPGTLNDSSPNIAPDGSIYLGAHDGKVHRFSGTAPLAQGSWPRAGANRRQTAWKIDLEKDELVDYFPDIQENWGNLSFVPWFGIGWISNVEIPLINHLDHDYLHLVQSSADGVIYYDYSIKAWVFAAEKGLRYYYRLQDSKWIYHHPGSTAAPHRWFYDLQQAKWLHEDALN